MKHAPWLESNTTCCKLSRECRTCPYPGAVAAFPVHSFVCMYICMYYVLVCVCMYVRKMIRQHTSCCAGLSSGQHSMALRSHIFFTVPTKPLPSAITMGRFSGNRKTRACSWPLTSVKAVLKNPGNCTSTPSYAFMTWHVIKHSHNSVACIVLGFRGVPAIWRGQWWVHNPGRDVQHCGRHIPNGGK